jgi:7 transmembrane receptor (rhodopsin family)
MAAQITTSSYVTVDSFFSTTARDNYTSSTFSSNSAYSHVPDFTKSQIIVIFIGVIGAFANSMVLFVMCFAKQYQKGTSNLFICNQTIMDGVSCIVLVSTMVMQMTGTTANTATGRKIFCLIFDSFTLLVGISYSAIFGLVLITLERYVKIVHPISHRNHFRPWMVKLGIALSWLNGLIVYMTPLWTVLTIDAHGRCIQIWPSTLSAESYGVALFIWQIVMPTAVFLICYGKILGVITRQNKVSGTLIAVTNNSALGAAVEGTDAILTHPLNNRGKSIIRTMIMITTCFFVCWCPIQLLSTINLWQPTTSTMTISQYLTFVAYLNVVINPIIYSAHLDVVGRTWRAMRHLVSGSNSSADNTSATRSIIPGSNTTALQTNPPAIALSDIGHS